jgi:Putative restriction endonuclease
VVFSRFDIVEPDLLYVANERAAEIVTKLHVEGSPDLVVEIGSPGTRTLDETIKRQLYERADVGSTGSAIRTPVSSASIVARAGNSTTPPSARPKRTMS